MSDALTRTWRPSYPLDLPRVLAPLRRGSGDPATRVDASGEVWWATTTPTGPTTLRLQKDGTGTVTATAWGQGARSVLDNVPDLLGDSDDDTGFVAVHDVVERGRRASRGVRLCTSGRVWDVLVAAVLEQKVTNREAWRSWRELCWRFGSHAPGPVEKLWVVPDPVQLRRIRDWEWHRAGIDGARRRTLIAAASVAGRLERAVELRGVEGRELLQKVPGIGPWTAAEVAQRAWGDPDAVSVGDFHLPTIVGTALVGHPVDDEGMLEALAPYEGQRHRAVRYLGAAGVNRPRYAPRMPIRNYRTM
ncbi:DNA-3-methyladenine glycosylase family protein [Saccharopolyspora pogona]|uniref:DNA-3-methyladenine glycosylase family protein n=1 Tax=Saccharopolyspora pogona TaxID=333966 RepID=UPI001689DE41|nr:DNA-3-methyladenine glycosylase 2 family protein [Saccharopolyspora pogona]